MMRFHVGKKDTRFNGHSLEDIEVMLHVLPAGPGGAFVGNGFLIRDVQSLIDVIRVQDLRIRDLEELARRK